MHESDILHDIIYLPRRFNETNDRSIHTLLIETGYAAVRDQITIKAIRSFLMIHPECVLDWLQYSENKRATAGWYLKMGCSGEYIVEYCPRDSKQKVNGQSFPNRTEACAVFVKREIDSILG